MTKKIIGIELVPASMHGVAPRKFVSRSSWDAVCAEVRKRARHACEFCGSSGHLHAHERYSIDGDVMRLCDIICVCRACHDVIHFGRALSQGKGERALARLMRLRGISRKEAGDMVRKSFTEWGRYPEKLDLDWSFMAKNFGHLLKPPELVASLSSSFQSPISRPRDENASEEAEMTRI